ncbi:unnamed protein product [Lymnaea stagnalis]|uniref:Uncharacterized protein n=1 Tax=Lymnaea stagnalis TaxID=6523 RepID=A0AAV2H4X9_LYMST
MTDELHCPDPSEVADFSKKMTLQEKLDFIDGEIRKIHIFCTKSGYSASQIEHLAKPFFDKDTNSISSTIWVSGKAWKRRAVALTTMIVATLFLFRYDPAYRLASALSKQGAIQILPLWDWTQLYHSPCWVNNPLYVVTGLQLSDCEICEAVDRVSKVSQVNGRQLMDEFIKRDVPVIVTDGLKDWPLAKNMTILKLAETYRGNTALNQHDSCGFSSSVKNGDHMKVLSLARVNKLDKFYAHWKNCNFEAAKAFRKLYQRPYFLPSSVSLLPTSWVSISANYSSRLYKPVDMTWDLLLFMQVKGKSRVKLQPWEPCTEVCSSFEEFLHEGEILVTTSFMWKLDYKPSKQAENIAVVVAGLFD